MENSSLKMMLLGTKLIRDGVVVNVVHLAGCRTVEEDKLVAMSVRN